MKTMKLIQILAAAAIFLTTTSAWALEQDSGYPWYNDLPKQDRQAVSQPNNVFETTIVPSDGDTGYPWFADIKDDRNAMKKPVTVFKPHPDTADHDSGYPWHADTKEDDLMQPKTKIQ
jgi:hypothetical protein